MFGKKREDKKRVENSIVTFSVARDSFLIEYTNFSFLLLLLFPNPHPQFLSPPAYDTPAHLCPWDLRVEIPCPPISQSPGKRQFLLCK